ncbi:MAG: hypothetical protein WDO73_21950 [Ignavibacteriota bacterium]
MVDLLSVFFRRRRIRHPFFPDLAAEPAVRTRRRARAIAGTFGELARAAARGVEARRAVYVLVSDGEPLSAGERDELWRLFQVPVYALVQRYGNVTAWECEAQNGLHVAGATGGGACPCGRPGVVMAQARPAAHAAD